MEALAYIIYILTILIPINGLLWMAKRNERERNRRILLAYWRMRRRS